MNFGEKKIIGPALVAVGFNRPGSLQRLLNSLSVASYDAPVPLVISIDGSDSEQGAATRNVAEQFNWSHGPKRLIFHEQNLGLRRHILGCGDLTSEYGAVIVLEDDLTVAKDFYRYTNNALKFVERNDQVAGVSLYSHATNVVARLPFVPLYDGFDNFYIQFASSWGQAWNATQWAKFREWLAQLSDASSDSGTTADSPVTSQKPFPIPSNAPIPPNVLSWSDSSWLKYFIWYLVETNRYFLYPRNSMTTNYNECGTHSNRFSPIWQVPLAARSQAWRFSELSESIAVYDAFFEVLPDRLRKCTNLLDDFDFDVDLYGTKPPHLLKRPFALTSKRQRGTPVKKFDLIRKPLEANFEIESRLAEHAMFSLSSSQQLERRCNLSLDNFRVIEYFYGLLSLKTLAMNLIRYVWQKRSG
jgi:hypothetical protein